MKTHTSILIYDMSTASQRHVEDSFAPSINGRCVKQRSGNLDFVAVEVQEQVFPCSYITLVYHQLFDSL